MYLDGHSELGIFGIGRKLKKTVKKLDPKKLAKKLENPLKKLAASLPITGDIVAAREAKKAADAEAKMLTAETATESELLTQQEAQSAVIKQRVITVAGLSIIAGAFYYMTRK